jgi:hypothetical protein
MEMTQCALTRRSFAHQILVDWFTEYFHENGDFEPNKLENHLDLCELKDIYDIYVREIQYLYRMGSVSAGEKYLVSYQEFSRTWNSVFPWVKIREYKAVSGKCWTCFYINEIRKTSGDSSVLLAAKHLHQLIGADSSCENDKGINQ